MRRWGVSDFQHTQLNCFSKIMAKLQTKIAAAILAVASMLVPATGQPIDDDCIVFRTHVRYCAGCVAARAIWEAGKVAHQWLLRRHRHTRRTARLEQVRTLASQAAQTAVAAQTAATATTSPMGASTSTFEARA